jgi:hypothetical protein
MALSWNVSKVKDVDSVCWEKRTENGVEDEYLAVRTDALIWACMAVELSGITESNAAEFWDRLSLWEQVSGPFRRTGSGPIYFTKRDVFEHIGLYTNVSNKSRSFYLKKLSDIALEKLTGRRNFKTQNLRGPLVLDEEVTIKHGELHSTVSTVP